MPPVFFWSHDPMAVTSIPPQLMCVQDSVSCLQDLAVESGSFSCVLETLGPALWLCTVTLSSGTAIPGGLLPPTTPHQPLTQRPWEEPGAGGMARPQVPVPSH